MIMAEQVLTPEEVIDFENLCYNEKVLKNLTNGDHFGEIAVLTDMKRTATVRAVDYSTISTLCKESIQELQTIFPTFISQFKHGIQHNYRDHDFLFKQKMIESVPFFSKLK